MTVPEPRIESLDQLAGYMSARGEVFPPNETHAMVIVQCKHGGDFVVEMFKRDEPGGKLQMSTGSHMTLKGALELARCELEKKEHG